EHPAERRHHRLDRDRGRRARRPAGRADVGREGHRDSDGARPRRQHHPSVRARRRSRAGRNQQVASPLGGRPDLRGAKDNSQPLGVAVIWWWLGALFALFVAFELWRLLSSQPRERRAVDWKRVYAMEREVWGHTFEHAGAPGHDVGLTETAEFRRLEYLL